jgi:hemolysin III
MDQSVNSTKLVKPSLRGWIHEGAFFVSLLAGALLIALASSPQAATAAAIFAITGSAMLGVSALYHRREWAADARRWMRKLDHSMIFLLIAGSYTPFALLVLDGTLADVVLAVVWIGAIAGCVMELVRGDSSKWVMAIVCLCLGWASVVAFPGIISAIGWGGASMLVVGGLAYTAGAIIYAAQKPNPFPSVFGYHEVFHSLVVIALALQYIVIAVYVLPA